MKLNPNTGQYVILLKKYQKHLVKGVIILSILVSAGLMACYFFMFSNTLDFVGFMFMLGPLLIVGMLGYSLVAVVKILQSLRRDMVEKSYETFIDQVLFIQSTSGKAKYSNKLVLKNRKEVITNLTNVAVLAGSTYVFTMSKRTQLIIDIRPVEKEVHEQQYAEILPGQGVEFVSSSSDRVLLEQEELKDYRQLHIVPTLLASVLAGGFAGMVIGALSLMVLGRFIGDHGGQVIIGMMVAGAAALFYFLLRFNQRHNAKVLANPYKRVMPATIESVKEVSRKKGTRYLVYFKVKDHSGKDKLNEELKYSQLELLKKQRGYFYLHVEENHEKVLKIMGEDKSELMRFY